MIRLSIFFMGGALVSDFLLVSQKIFRCDCDVVVNVRETDRQIYFDLYRSMTISEEGIEDGLNYLRFEDILQYVAIGSIRIEKRTSNHRLKKRPTKPDGNGRNDIIFLFNFLRNKGVKHIIRVIVDDTLDPPHSDESIEKAVGGLRVEKWDWRKFDLCAETITTAAPDAREVDVYWSGNNAVLRSWGEPAGLASLRKLELVNLHVNQVSLRPGYLYPREFYHNADRVDKSPKQ